MNRSQITQIFSIFEQLDPSPQTELIYSNPFTLMIAVILSAQATDQSVNKVISPILDQIDSPEKILALGLDNLKEKIKSLNIYQNKSKYIYNTSQILIQEFHSEVPLIFSELVQLPGIGRKTANVILNVLTQAPTIAVDTHVFRVIHRIGITHAKTPTQLEEKLYKLVPKTFWNRINHWLVLHGRNICKARKPLCAQCPVQMHCGYYQQSLSENKLSAPQ